MHAGVREQTRGQQYSHQTFDSAYGFGLMSGVVMPRIRALMLAGLPQNVSDVSVSTVMSMRVSTLRPITPMQLPCSSSSLSGSSGTGASRLSSSTSASVLPSADSSAALAPESALRARGRGVLRAAAAPRLGRAAAAAEEPR